jgi:lysophospholipase L1-like esterase
VKDVSSLFPYILFIIIIFFDRSRIKYCKDKDFSYTALGDDLSSGIIALLLRSFTYRVNRFLKVEHPKVVFNNFAKTGFTSSNLIFQLQNDWQIRRCLQSSRLVTISIGINNLLDHTEENYNEINGNVARIGIEEFREDWPMILEYIRINIASKAKIYIMTIFNPYEEDDPNYTIAEYYISKVNSIIKSKFWIKTFDYEVVDVYELFKVDKSSKLTLYNSIIKMPIPSRRGYKQIAEAFINVIKN